MLVTSAAVVCVESGCIELQALLGVLPPGEGGGTSGGAGGGTGGGGGNGGDTGLPIVSLTASNVTPQLDEQVTLTCTLTSGSTDGLSFSFDSSLARLTVDEQQGTGQFIVEQTDLGVSYVFQCAATNNVGSGPRSQQVVVTPTDLAAP